PVIGAVEGLRWEAAAVAVHTPRGVKRRGAQARAVERVGRGGVAAPRGGRRGDVARARPYRPRAQEVALLPAWLTVVSEPSAGEQLAIGGPQIAHERTGGRRSLVEPDCVDEAVGLGVELHADFDRLTVIEIGTQRGVCAR